MNITGIEYFVVSNKKPDIVLNGFNKAIAELWPNCIIYEDDKLFDGRFFMGMLKIMKWRISQKKMPINLINMEKAKYHWHASTIGH